jgi:hypothetical protein
MTFAYASVCLCIFSFFFPARPLEELGGLPLLSRLIAIMPVLSVGKSLSLGSRSPGPEWLAACTLISAEAAAGSTGKTLEEKWPRARGLTLSLLLPLPLLPLLLLPPAWAAICFVWDALMMTEAAVAAAAAWQVGIKCSMITSN